MDLKRYWNAVLKQQAEEMRCFFHKEAYVNWHNTNEHFTADEFVEVNCRYPGQWDGDIERVVENGEVTVVAVHVFSCDKKQSFHVTSFIREKEGKIVSVDEYWGDDGTVPQWRKEQHIGTPIRA